MPSMQHRHGAQAHASEAFTLKAPGAEVYSHQYANIYWLRLAQLRKRVTLNATRAFAAYSKDGQPPPLVERVLNVEAGKTCFIVGTLYIDMPLKPNVLEDLAQNHSLHAPPPRTSYASPSDEVMLEDESGRVRLVGPAIDDRQGSFVTGTIMAALGRETPSGDFEVVDCAFAGVPDRAAATAASKKSSKDEWVAIASGLSCGSSHDPDDMRLALLKEWLLGEAGSATDASQSAAVSRLILAGDSLVQPVPAETESHSARRGMPTYSPKPTASLDAFLDDILPAIPVDIMTGASDPASPFLPQQPLHHALLPRASRHKDFARRSNPVWLDCDGRSLLGTSGQTLDDIFKYTSTAVDSRAHMARLSLEWSHIAPTCPDTLWCHPFADDDPFLLASSPDFYFVGCQPKFETLLVPRQASSSSMNVDHAAGDAVRVVLVPRFAETGEVVLVNLATSETRVVKFDLQ